MRVPVVHQARDRHGWRDTCVDPAVTGDGDPDLGGLDEVLNRINPVILVRRKRNPVSPGLIVVEYALGPLMVEALIGAEPRISRTPIDSASLPAEGKPAMAIAVAGIEAPVAVFWALASA
jgi:hypothetical protein